MSKITKTPEQALAELRQQFIFDNYVGESGQWLTVGRVVEKYLELNSKVFDLGSGPCDKTAIAQLMGCKCTAVDDLNDDWHLKNDNVAKIEKYAASIGINFSREFIPPAESTYDMVMMNDVLEHIHDSPRDLLNMLVSGLKEEGYLFITVPNLANIRKRIDLLRGRSNLPNYDLYYWYRGTWRGPQREYVRNDLISLCSNIGLEIIELRAVHHMLQRLPNYARLPYKALTAIFPDFRDSWLLVARKPANWNPKDELSDSEFAEIYGVTSNEYLYE